MEDNQKIELAETVEPKSRRAFVKGAAKAAVAAPAAVLLLNATTKSAKADTTYQKNPLPSDLRLKQDVHPIEKLPNGIQLYSFRYWNDDKTFVGVVAQDLLEDERFSHAVIEDESGYYVVDFGALGLDVSGSADAFVETGWRALKAATPVIN